MASRGFLLLLWISLAMTMEIPTKCERDSDCSEVDYCLSSMCERCIPCQEILHRQPPPSPNGRNVCAKTEDDCGVCMPGYQSEDLVGQRRSMKCFPTSFNDERPNDTHATVPTLGVAMTSIFVALMITVMAAGSCLVYVKHRQLTTETSGREREENKKLVDRLPPPYELPDESGEICGPVHVSQRNFALVAAQPEYLNQATPINHFHHPKPKVDSDVEEDHGILNGPEPQPVFEDGDGSTETIPSLWEPSSANDLQMESVSEPDLFRPTQSQELRSLVRCQSLELPPIRPVYNRVLSATISDPTLPTDNGRRSSGGESYAHRHVRLSMHRLAISQVTEEMRQGENAPSCSTLPGGHCDDDCEPSEPQSFVFDDSQVSTTDVSYESNFLTTSLLSFTGSLYGRPFSSSTPTANEAGSRDSGFFDQSRRRPATEEAGFGVALFIKRPREFE